MLRRRHLIICSIIVLLAVGGIFLSYSISKLRAEAIAQSAKGDISTLKGQLVLFIGDDFTPCWVFRGEYKDAMTGSTFDVYVSILGRVVRIPSTEMKKGKIIDK